MKKAWLAAVALGLGAGAFGFAQQRVELEFWSWYLSPKFDDYLKGVIADFQRANPGITVKFVDKQDTMERDLTAAINLGRSPDVVNLWIDATAAAAQNNLLTPLSEVTTAAALSGQYWDNVTNMFTVNGRAYGFPWYGWTDQGVMAYNSDILQRAGVTALPKTIEELLAASRTIKDKTGAYGWLPPIKDPNGASFLGQFYLQGLPIIQSGRAVFNTATHAAYLKRFVDLMRADYIPEDLLRKEAFQLNNELYSQGKSTFIVGGAQALTRVKDANKDIYAKTKVVAAPLGKAGVQTGGAMSLVIPRASKNKREAALFAAYMTNNANQVKFAKLAGIVPTTRGAENDPELKSAGTDALDMATSMVSVTGRYINPGWKPPKNTDAVYKNFNDNIEAAFLGRKTPQQALTDAAIFWNANAK